MLCRLLVIALLGLSTTAVMGLPNDPDIFRRGDADGNGGVAINDAIVVANWLRLAGDEPDCVDSADADDSGLVDDLDPLFILAFLMLGGPPPPAPGPYSNCASDPTPDILDCGFYEC